MLTWLPDVLRAAGVDTYVMPGALTRGSRGRGLSPRGIVWHHTATGTNWSDGSVAALLRDGRRDLAGPLSQVGVERDGTWVIVACGRANHNGYGTWGNNSIGLEFYNKGDGIDPWPRVQIDSGAAGSAAILRHLGKRAATAVLGHKETDPRRKVDPRGLDMGEIRRHIDRYIRRPPEAPDIMSPEALVWWAFITFVGRAPSDADVKAGVAEIAKRGEHHYLSSIWNAPEAVKRRG